MNNRRERGWFVIVVDTSWSMKRPKLLGQNFSKGKLTLFNFGVHALGEVELMNSEE
jgi:hypothetical protein